MASVGGEPDESILLKEYNSWSPCLRELHGWRSLHAPNKRGLVTERSMRLTLNVHLTINVRLTTRVYGTHKWYIIYGLA